MQKTNLVSKTIFLLIFAFYMGVSKAQPLSPPIPFNDEYRGTADLIMKAAKVKTKRTYYKFNEGNVQNILYTDFEYNKKGYLVSQKWYSLLSKKEMYSAYYEYDNEDFFTSCTEKISKDFDYFEECSRKRTNEGYPVNYTDTNPFGETIPADKDSNIVVKTVYSRDSTGGYFAKKFYYDGSFYKEKALPFWQFGPLFYDNLYINEDKSIDYVFSEKYFKTDTLYQSADTLKIRIRIKQNNLECVGILKIKQNNIFVITEIDRMFDKMKLSFSYQNSFLLDDGTRRSEIRSITYLSYKINYERLLLIHKFQSLDTTRISLYNRIELNDMHNPNMQYFIHAQGCINYTNFKDGYLDSESQYSIGLDSVQKLRDVYYGGHNLISEKIQYSASFGLIPSSRSVNYDYVTKIVEINMYEYFK